MQSQNTTATDEAGSYLSPVGKGGVLAGAPSALQVRVKRALERYEDATFWANGAQKADAINDLLDELRLIASTRPPQTYVHRTAADEANRVIGLRHDRAEYERYTTLMEQAEERKS